MAYTKRPKKQELYDQVDALTRENIKLLAELERRDREKWERNREKATETFYNQVGGIFPNALCKVQLDHIDTAGYWFSFELTNDDRRQVYAVRHTDFEEV